MTDKSFKLRAYNKVNMRAWVFSLDTDGYILCPFQNCIYIAFDVEEMSQHYAYCSGRRPNQDYQCQFCGKVAETKNKLHDHMIFFHFSDVTSKDIKDFIHSEVEDKQRVVSRVLEVSWEIYLTWKKYIKCHFPQCLYITNDIEDMKNHHLSYCSYPLGVKNLTCPDCLGRATSVIGLEKHRAEAKHEVERYPRSVSRWLIVRWVKSIEWCGWAKCAVLGCHFIDTDIMQIRDHYPTCQGSDQDKLKTCSQCGAWLFNRAKMEKHIRVHHTDKTHPLPIEYTNEFKISTVVVGPEIDPFEPSIYRTLSPDDESSPRSDDEKSEIDNDRADKRGEAEEPELSISTKGEDRKCYNKSSREKQTPVVLGVTVKKAKGIDCPQTKRQRPRVQVGADFVKKNPGLIESPYLVEKMTRVRRPKYGPPEPKARAEPRAVSPVKTVIGSLVEEMERRKEAEGGAVGEEVEVELNVLTGECGGPPGKSWTVNIPQRDLADGRRNLPKVDGRYVVRKLRQDMDNLMKSAFKLKHSPHQYPTRQKNPSPPCTETEKLKEEGDEDPTAAVKELMKKMKQKDDNQKVKEGPGIGMSVDDNIITKFTVYEETSEGQRKESNDYVELGNFSKSALGYVKRDSNGVEVTRIEIEDDDNGSSCIHEIDEGELEIDIGRDGGEENCGETPREEDVRVPTVLEGSDSPETLVPLVDETTSENNNSGSVPEVANSSAQSSIDVCPLRVSNAACPHETEEDKIETSSSDEEISITDIIRESNTTRVCIGSKNLTVPSEVEETLFIIEEEDCGNGEVRVKDLSEKRRKQESEVEESACEDPRGVSTVGGDNRCNTSDTEGVWSGEESTDGGENPYSLYTDLFTLEKRASRRRSSESRSTTGSLSPGPNLSVNSLKRQEGENKKCPSDLEVGLFSDEFSDSDNECKEKEPFRLGLVSKRLRPSSRRPSTRVEIDLKEKPDKDNVSLTVVDTFIPESQIKESSRIGISGTAPVVTRRSSKGSSPQVLPESGSSDSILEKSKKEFCSVCRLETDVPSEAFRGFERTRYNRSPRVLSDMVSRLSAKESLVQNSAEEEVTFLSQDRAVEYSPSLKVYKRKAVHPIKKISCWKNNTKTNQQVLDINNCTKEKTVNLEDKKRDGKPTEEEKEFSNCCAPNEKNVVSVKMDKTWIEDSDGSKGDSVLGNTICGNYREDLGSKEKTNVVVEPSLSVRVSNRKKIIFKRPFKRNQKLSSRIQKRETKPKFCYVWIGGKKFKRKVESTKQNNRSHAIRKQYRKNKFDIKLKRVGNLGIENIAELKRAVSLANVNTESAQGNSLSPILASEKEIGEPEKGQDPVTKANDTIPNEGHKHLTRRASVGCIENENKGKVGEKIEEIRVMTQEDSNLTESSVVSVSSNPSIPRESGQEPVLPVERWELLLGRPKAKLHSVGDSKGKISSDTKETHQEGGKDKSWEPENNSLVEAPILEKGGTGVPSRTPSIGKKRARKSNSYNLELERMEVGDERENLTENDQGDCVTNNLPEKFSKSACEERTKKVGRRSKGRTDLKQDSEAKKVVEKAEVFKSPTSPPKKRGRKSKKQLLLESMNKQNEKDLQDKNLDGSSKDETVGPTTRSTKLRGRKPKLFSPQMENRSIEGTSESSIDRISVDETENITTPVIPRRRGRKPKLQKGSSSVPGEKELDLVGEGFKERKDTKSRTGKIVKEYHGKKRGRKPKRYTAPESDLEATAEVGTMGSGKRRRGRPPRMLLTENCEVFKSVWVTSTCSSTPLPSSVAGGEPEGLHIKTEPNKSVDTLVMCDSDDDSGDAPLCIVEADESEEIRDEEEGVSVVEGTPAGVLDVTSELSVIRGTPTRVTELDASLLESTSFTSENKIAEESVAKGGLRGVQDTTVIGAPLEMEMEERKFLVRSSEPPLQCEESKPKIDRRGKLVTSYTKDDGTVVELGVRIDIMTRLEAPNKQVQCAICKSLMTAKEYQKEHLVKHNFMCWLEGEVPLPLENMSMMDIILTRGKRSNPKLVFTCEMCGETKKSGRGFLSHWQICGKSMEERESLLVECDECNKRLLPSSMLTHKAVTHRPKPLGEIIEETGMRKAASRCLSIMSSSLGLDPSNSNDASDKLICKDCDFATLSEKSFRHHMKSHNGEDSDTQSFENEDRRIAPGSGKRLEYIRKTVQIKEAVEMTKVMRDVHYSQSVLFPELDLSAEALSEVLSEEEAAPYLPQNIISTRLSLEGSEWTSLKRFKTLLKKGTELLFCGDGVWALGWAPDGTTTPVGFTRSGQVMQVKDAVDSSACEGSQYLLVGLTNCKMTHTPATTPGYPGVLQLWEFPGLDNTRVAGEVTESKTRMAYGVAHSYGAVWGMDWCPSGAKTDTRMGLVALATSHGSIPIYSLPYPTSEQSERPAFYNFKPVLVLEQLGMERHQCTRVSWSKSIPHNIIVGGFSNGFIGVWDLDLTSALLRQGTTLYPYHTFQAHFSIITGLSFVGHCLDTIVTCSVDRYTTYWDLRDTSSPCLKQKKGLAMDTAWLPNSMCSVTGYDDGYKISGNGTLSISSYRNFGTQPQMLISDVESSVWSISCNDWLNSLAVSYDNGSVMLILEAFEEKRRPAKVVVQSVLHDFQSKTPEEEPKKGKKKAKENAVTANFMDSDSYQEAANRFGLRIVTDMDVPKSDKLTSEETDKLDVYPLTSANRVCWNPNASSFLNMSIGYQSGFILVSKVILPKVTGFWRRRKYNRYSSQ